MSKHGSLFVWHSPLGSLFNLPRGPSICHPIRPDVSRSVPESANAALSNPSSTDLEADLGTLGQMERRLGRLGNLGAD